MRKPTLQSLAAQLSVSRQTISNAINAPEKVHPRTLARVRAAIEDAGYQPSAAARALRTKRSMALALRLPSPGDGMNGQVMDNFLHAVTTEAAVHSYRVLLFTAADPLDELEQLNELRAARLVDGCILTDTRAGDPRPDRLHAAGTPFAAFGRPWDGSDAHSWVDVDGHTGVRVAVDHLAELGHDPIGFIGWPDVAGVGVDRRNGWLAATGYDTATADLYSEGVQDNLFEAADAMARLISHGVEAVVTASDTLAIGAAHELQRHGLPPAVVGYDDTPVARALGISSLHQPVEAAARSLVQMVLAAINHPDPPRRTQLLAPTLQVRDVADQFITNRPPQHVI